MAKTARTIVVPVRFTVQERALIDRVATRQNVAVSAYIREAALREAKGDPGRVRSNPQPPHTVGGHP